MSGTSGEFAGNHDAPVLSLMCDTFIRISNTNNFINELVGFEDNVPKRDTGSGNGPFMKQTFITHLFI